MSENILYEFSGFKLNPLSRSLSHNDATIALRPVALELLLVLVRNHGKTLTKAELIRMVWKTGEGIEADNKFHVTLTAVRQALKDPAKNPRLIVKDIGGYRFVAPVRVVPLENDPTQMRNGARSGEGAFSGSNELKRHDEVQSVPMAAVKDRRHLLHIVVSCTLYAALYAVAISVEVAYEFDQFGSQALRISPLVFAWIWISSAVGLMVDQRWTSQNKKGGLFTSVLIFGISALVVIVGLGFLPNFPITQAQFQTYPAQAAYIKDVFYFLLLAILFLILPFHFLTQMQTEIGRSTSESEVQGVVNPNPAQKQARNSYQWFWALVLLLAVFAVIALVMTAHLLDNLRPGSYQGMFTVLLYVRGALYFGLGIECLVWYRTALAETLNSAEPRND